MEEDDGNELNLTDIEIEFAESAASYDEVLTKCKLLRSRLLMIKADTTGASSSHNQSSNPSILESVDKIEDQFHNIMIQEEIMKGIKTSTLACSVFSRDGPYDGLDDLLKEYCANEAKIFELSKAIQQERLAHAEAASQYLNLLCQYIGTLKEDQTKLNDKSSSVLEIDADKKQFLEKQIKDIRFMQLCISKIVIASNIDLTASKHIRDIVKSVRNPITSIDQFL